MKFPKNSIILLLFLILLMQVFLRIPFLQEPLEGDEAVYAYIADGLSLGEVPYKDVFDHKPPAIYFAFALILKLLGRSILGVRLASLIFGLLTTLVLFAVGLYLLGPKGGLAAAFLYGLFSGGPYIEGSNSNTETFMILFILLGLLFFLMGAREEKRRSWFYFLAGISSGLAFMFKQVALFNFIALLLFVTPFPFTRQIFKQMKELARSWFWLIIGFLIFPLIFFVYFYSKSALKDFIELAYLFNFNYVKPNIIFFLFRIVTLAYLENSILWVLALVGAIYILFKDREKGMVFLVVWGLFSLAGSWMGGYGFGHYFIQALPTLCLLSGYALLKWRKNRPPLWINTAGIAILVFLGFIIILNQFQFYMFYNPAQISMVKYAHPYQIIAYEIGNRIKPTLKRDDYILVKGMPQIYFYSGARAPSRFFYGLPMLGGYRASFYMLQRETYRVDFMGSVKKEYAEMEIKDAVAALRNKKTKYFIVKSEFLRPAHLPEINSNYEFVKEWSRGAALVFRRAKNT
jgi:4-amino-4-deoxy-L-arabinose transferase-like glycosyltransferase